MSVRETSKAIFNEIREGGYLSKQRWQAYEVIHTHGPITAREVDRTAGLHLVKMSRSMQPAITWLVETGTVTEVGKRPCKVTGNTVITYMASGKLPKKPKAKIRLTAEQKFKALKAIRKLWKHVPQEDQDIIRHLGKWLGKGLP